MRKLLVALLATGSMLFATAGLSSADPNLPDIRAHRHFVVTPTGEMIQVGPNLCDDPTLQDAFNQFHTNIHRGVPALDAFTHEHNPVNLVARPCSFVP